MMIVALIDNGSLEPAAQRNLRAVAAALAARIGTAVEPVSWKHSDRIAPSALDDRPAQTLRPWVLAQVARGHRDFLFAPFFVSAQGAIGSALRSDLEKLSDQVGGISFTFSAGLDARGALADIVVARIRETLSAKKLARPAVIVVDHGGPSAASAMLRDAVVLAARTRLGLEIGPLIAASMEGAGHAHNRPLLAEVLAAKGFHPGDVVIAPLFLSPGRHAGADGDLARIARHAESQLPGLRVYFTDLVGTHPCAIEALAAALRQALSATAYAHPA